jgi:ferredoxin
MIKIGFQQRFLMARMTRLPILGRAMELAFFEEDRMIYLPKDAVAVSARLTTIELDSPVSQSNVVLPSRVIDHFIQKSRYIFIMNHCMCRRSNNCQHYPQDLGCVFLGAGVLKIPPSMGHMATAEEAMEHMRKGRERGLVHLIGRNKIDSVWLNTGPKEELLSICNCCECCCLWKMLPQLSGSISSGVMRMPGVTLTVTDRCVGCGSCVDDRTCFVNAIVLSDGRATIDEELCRGCGRCVERCPQDAIDITIDPQVSIVQAVRSIEPLVDVRKE